ncbi:MAG TPA: hypothetical protein PKE63_08460 [Lacibacter sp.]|nr:hypothetical protein [Lacibacter sp.]HMP87297.1 hypothetical protein [Lacibacter sp.]
MATSDLRLLLASILFLLLFVAGWPWYHSILDADGVGYAAVARAYADGRWQEAINGYWSPLHAWLVVPLLKAGVEVVMAFKYSNAFIAVLILVVLHNLLRKLDIHPALQTALLFTAVIPLLQFACYELAADLLLVLLLLAYVNLLLQPAFFTSVRLYLLAGVLGALAYFAKAYAFPFFLVHFILFHFLWGGARRNNRYLFAGLGVFFLLCTPWIVLLYHKYGTWMISSAGRLNQSWYLVPERNPDLAFLPPPHAGASSWWEDPSLVQKTYYTAFASGALFLHQLRVLLYNIQQWFLALFALSPLAPGILAAWVVQLVVRPSQHLRLFLLTALLLPAGYLLIHIEVRFLWLLAFLLPAGAVLLLEPLVQQYVQKAWQRVLIWALVLGSFLAEPVNILKDYRYRQQELHTLAGQLRSVQLQGAVTSNINSEEGMLLAWLAGFQYHMPSAGEKPVNALLPVAAAHGIFQVLFFYSSAAEKEQLLREPVAAHIRQYTEIQPGLLLLYLQPE